MELASDLATRAMELDEELAEAQTAMGLVRIFRDHDWQAAERRFERALEINPSFEFAHRAYALLLVQQGRHDEAQREIERAREIDPLNAFVASLAGDVYWWGGVEEKGMDLWREATALDAGHPLGRQGLAVALCEQGQVEESLTLFGEARVLSEDDPLVIGDQGYCLSIAGRADEARDLLRELELQSATAWVSPLAIARIHLGLGDRDAALDELERAWEVRAYRLLEIGVDPRWDLVRADRRFQEVLSHVGLAES